MLFRSVSFSLLYRPYMISSSFLSRHCYFDDSDDEVHSENNASRVAKTSASQTLIVSEDPKISPEATDPEKSPRALKKKKSKTTNAGKGSSSPKTLRHLTQTT